MAVVFGTPPVDKKTQEWERDLKTLDKMPGLWARLENNAALKMPEAYCSRLKQGRVEGFNPENYDVRLTNNEVWVRRKIGTGENAAGDRAMDRLRHAIAGGVNDSTIGQYAKSLVVTTVRATIEPGSERDALIRAHTEKLVAEGVSEFDAAARAHSLFAD